VKNILVLTGSPRNGGNSELLADAFIEGAEKKGHKVTKFKTAAKKIGGCKACQMCWSNKGACVFNDDFDELQPLIESADVLVLATPLYWFSMSAQLKNAVDRLYAYSVDNSKKKLKIKESLLLSCAASDEKDDFSGLINTYYGIIKHLNITDKGIFTVNSVNKKGDIKNTSALTTASLIAENYNI
jgi:multimeric flavodoxin WrbA